MLTLIAVWNSRRQNPLSRMGFLAESGAEYRQTFGWILPQCVDLRRGEKANIRLFGLANGKY
jgi:hypothetical protein